MQKQIAEIKAKHPKIKGNLLTVDGVHMNPLGNIMMAEGILRAFGLTDAQLSAAEKAWSNRVYNQSVSLTVEQYNALAKKSVPEQSVGSGLPEKSCSERDSVIPDLPFSAPHGKIVFRRSVFSFPPARTGMAVESIPLPLSFRH